ncbi:MAG: hypothetical protein JJT76_07060 [Clostridiaceae bacterium]|nr:hypothetical protein [Clostridiaceae bacterium]
MNNYAKKMIAMQLIFYIFKSFVLIFVNIYLWKTGRDIKVVAIFNLFNYIAAFVSFYIANIIALKSVKLNYLLSSISFITLFVLTAIFEESISQYAIYIGILAGFGEGLFYFNLNVFQAYYLDKNETDRFMSISGMTTKAASIITPVVSGIVIERYGFLQMVYVLMFLLGVQVFNSLSLPSTNIEYMAKINLKKMFHCKDQRKVMSTHLIHTPFGQFIIMANSVFLYSFARSEALMGYLNSAFAIAAILLYLLYIKMQKHFTRKKLTFIGVIALALSVSLLFKPSFITFVLFSLSIGLGDAFFNKPLNGVQIYSSKKYAESEEEILGNLVFRVFLLTLSRSAFYLLIYFFYVDSSSTIFTLLVIYNMLSPITSYYLVKKQI